MELVRNFFRDWKNKVWFLSDEKTKTKIGLGLGEEVL